jgi:hypothetical protein
MFGVWCGVAYLVLLFIGWGAAAGFLPPTHPSDSAAQIAKLFGEDHTRIRIGMVVIMVAALAFIPFAAVCAQYVSRVEKGPGVLTYTFLLSAAGNMMLTFYPAIWWLTAAFRPDRAGDLTQLVNDMAWIQFLGGVTIYLAMPLTIMIVALCDSSEAPVFPRWAGWANMWFAISITPDQLLFFFKTGPFAWNGLFGVWLPILWFGGFFVVNVIVVRQAVIRDRGSRLETAVSPTVIGA